MEHGWTISARQERECRRLALYALTVVLEAPAVAARYVATLIVASIVLSLTGLGLSATTAAKIAAFGPLAWSALALATPYGSAWWWRERSGGRPPSPREREAYRQGLRELLAHAPAGVRLPREWFVLDTPIPQTAAYGETLLLSRAVLELPEDHLRALLAHALGHLQGLDARLAVAVNRLVLQPLRPPRPPAQDTRHTLGTGEEAGNRRGAGEDAHDSHRPAGARRDALHLAASLLRGGIGLRIAAPLWGAVWRAQEYEADAFAVTLGEGEVLAEALERYTLELDRPVPLSMLSARAHPPIEHRIARLRGDAGERHGRDDNPRPEPAASSPPLASTWEPGWIGRRAISCASSAAPASVPRLGSTV